MAHKRLAESPEKMKQRIVCRESRPVSARSFPGELHPILQLQQMLGNRCVAQLIQGKRLTPEGKIIGLQRKLTVGAADDQYEQEADRVARQVMNTSDAVAAHSMQRAMSPEEDKDQRLQPKPLAVSITPFVQRQHMVHTEDSEDQEKPIQAKLCTEMSKESMQRQPETEEEETEPIQAKSVGALTENFEAGADVETQVSQSIGRGSPLPDSVRAYMEPRFGADFSGVRVHSDNDSTQLNRFLRAQAFTVGRDIYYGAGKAPTDLRLTAHELTHVVQQDGGQLHRARTQVKEEAAIGGAPSGREKGPVHFPSTVRIHTGSQAAESAAAIQARAYTSGRDVVFGTGKYRPASEGGRRLLAHELVHVGQQPHGNLLVQRDGVGDARTAEEYAKIITQIKSGQKYQSLGPVEKQTTGDIIDAIEKNSDWPTRYSYIANLNTLFRRSAKKADLDVARATILRLGLDVRKVTALLDILIKPLQGYVASGFDFSSRFFQHATPLGFSVETRALGSYPASPYDRSQPASVTDPAEESFKKSDILFFSGHQYAQYKEPGTFTNDASDSCFNIGMLSKENKRVKLVVSTSCATICKDVARIWRNKFPDALILGYRFSAPLNGGIVANAFASTLLKKGPIDLSDAGGLEQIRSAWKAVVLGQGSIEGGPGLLFGTEVEIYSNGKWIKKPWDDKANECHYH